LNLTDVTKEQSVHLAFPPPSRRADGTLHIMIEVIVLCYLSFLILSFSLRLLCCKSNFFLDIWLHFKSKIFVPILRYNPVFSSLHF